MTSSVDQQICQCHGTSGGLFQLSAWNVSDVTYCTALSQPLQIWTLCHELMYRIPKADQAVAVIHSIR